MQRKYRHVSALPDSERFAEVELEETEAHCDDAYSASMG